MKRSDSTITFRELAKKAGVSVGTVSNVLAGTVPVSPERRKRVLEAIRETRYHPNFVARSLKLNRTKILGIVIADITNLFFALLLRGAEDVAIRRGYALLGFNSDDRLEREKYIFGVLRSRRVDGLLLVVAPGPKSRPHILDMLKLGTPIVCLDRVPTGIKIDSVTVRNVEGTHQCVRHLIELGHRRIGIITGSLSMQTGWERLEGYKAALAEAGIEIAPELIREGDFHSETGYNSAVQLLSGINAPTALFISNNVMAIGALKAITELGLRCPQDVAVATFDDLPVTQLFNPPLTAVSQPAYSIGQVGTELLIDRIESRVTDSSPLEIRLPTQLVIRGSTSGYEQPKVSFRTPADAARGHRGSSLGDAGSAQRKDADTANELDVSDQSSKSPLKVV
jgi:LacI family transcriptional regulator, galactose operon repressor